MGRLGFEVVGELHANKYPKAPLDIANAGASVKFALFSTNDPALSDVSAFGTN